MKLYLFLILLMFSQCLFSETYNWEIFDINGRIVHNIDNAKNVQNFHNNRMLVQYKDSYAVLDRNFKTLISKDIRIKQFATLRNDNIPFYDRTKDKFGYLSLTGDISINSIYDSVENFIDGYAIVGFGDTSEPPPNLLDLEIINTSGKSCSNFTSNYIYLSEEIKGKGIAIVNGKYEIISNIEGHWISDNINNGKYRTMKSVGKYVIYRKDNKYGFMTWDGKELTQPIFSSIQYSSNSSVFNVDTSSKLNQFVDVFGNIVSTIQGTDKVIADGRYSIVKADEKYGLYDLSTQNHILDPVYNSIIGIDNDVLMVKLDNRYGYISIDGSSIGQIKYDLIKPFENGIAIAGKLIE